MATGYTHPVKDGIITSFKDFARSCARAFGANIMMRDEPQGAPIREYQPSTYHKDALEAAKEKLYDAERMTMEEAERRAVEERTARVKALEASLADHKLSLARYSAMLAQVRAWQPPTPDHEGLKKFMIEQLEESIRWDCDSRPLDSIALKSAKDFKTDAVKRAREEIAYHEKEWAEEVERTAQRNAWNKALFESLK